MKKVFFAICSVLTAAVIGYFLVRKTKKYQEWRTEFGNSEFGKKVLTVKTLVNESVKDSSATIKKVLGQEVTTDTESKN
jgi:hypothetical protein